MEEIDIESTSSHSATCSDIVLREGKRVRLIFRPELVDNPKNPEARVRGKFFYQRKGDGDSWQPVDKIPLSSLKKGENFQLELHAGEVLTLRHDLYELARIHRKGGIPLGSAHFLKVKDNLAALLELTEGDLAEFFSGNEADAITVLKRVLRWLCNSPTAASKIALDEVELPTLNGLISRANIAAILRLWASNADNSDEEFWQRELAKHTFVLSLLFSYPIVVIKDKAYVGGKEYDNRRGNLVDFLARIPNSRNAVLIEIKTPTTPLLGSQYRQDVFPMSADIIGAISQAMHYRDSLLADPRVRESADLSPAEARCLVIAGSANRELKDPGRQQSFERFRERLLGLTIVTFDEMFKRLDELQKLFA